MAYKKISFAFVFNRKNMLDDKGRALVQIKAYQNGKNRYFSTEVYLEPKHWDERNKRVKPAHPQAHELNKRLQHQRDELEEYEIKMMAKNGRFSIDQLKAAKEQPGQIEVDFTAFWEKEIEAHSMKENSKRAVRQTLNKVKEMQKQVFFDDLTFAFVQDFDRRLRKQALSLNTINKHHKRLKTFISLAVKYGHLKPEHNPYGRFKFKGEEPERPCLNEEELERLEQLVFLPGEKHLERHRDFLLLQCYTGLRFSDVAHLTPSKMSWSSEGITLHFKAEKTGKPLTLPLYHLFPDADGNSRPGAIVERYFKPLAALGEIGAQLMPLKIENQPLNRSLKILAQRAGISKRVTTHIGRRTFATIMATKVQAPVLQKLLQHSTPSMTNIYVQMSNKAIEDELKKVTWK